MKRVHDNKQLAHLFCNMVDADLEGFKNPSGSMYVRSGVMYSYGSHYPMARKLQIGVGSGYRQVLALNSNKSSTTTERQKYHLRHSASYAVLDIPNVLDIKSDENETYLMDCIVDAIDSTITGCKYSNGDIDYNISQFNVFCRYIGRKEFELPEDFASVLSELEIENAIKGRERLRQREAAELEKNKAIINRTHSNLHYWVSNSDRTVLGMIFVV